MYAIRSYYEPLNSVKIKDAIDELVEIGVPVTTVNTDMPGSKRMSFVGQDFIIRITSYNVCYTKLLRMFD